MLHAVLSQKYKTHKTPVNRNNLIGLPLTVLSLEEDAEAAVFEMGMDTFGEIHRMAEIVRPDIAIITNVGVAHIERLGSREGILSAKLEIRDFFGPENVLIINDEGDLLNRAAAISTANYHPGHLVKAVLPTDLTDRNKQIFAGDHHDLTDSVTVLKYRQCSGNDRNSADLRHDLINAFHSAGTARRYNDRRAVQLPLA